jgi:hypothetical protein
MTGLEEHPMMAFHPKSFVVLLLINLNVTSLPVLEEIISGSLLPVYFPMSGAETLLPS